MSKIVECCVCKTNTTTNTVETDEGTIAVCHECADDAKKNFIFVCVQCGGVFKRDKEEAELRWGGKDESNPIVMGLKKLKDQQVIIGISSCIECPEVAAEEEEIGHA